MRRGNGTGGRKPPRSGWPSLPSACAGATALNSIQCQPGGSAMPSAAGGSSRSSVALIACTGQASMRWRIVWLRPTHSVR
jgi:hypothetical protein